MKKIAFVLFINLFFGLSQVSAQISKIVDDFVAVTQQPSVDTTVVIDSSAQKIAELKLQLLQMQLNEMKLLSDLKNGEDKSEVNFDKQRRIDSLRNLTQGVKLVVEGDTLFTVYASIGGITAAERVKDTENRIVEIGKKYRNGGDTLSVLNLEHVTEIMYGERVVFSVTEDDAIWGNVTRLELSDNYSRIIKEKIVQIKEKYGLTQIIKRIVFFLLVLLAQFLLFKLTMFLHRKLKDRISRFATTKLRSVIVKDYEFLTKERQASILMFFALIARYAFTLIQLIITIPILFSIFPQTETLAIKIFSYIYMPIRTIFQSFIAYIPNIFIIIIIYLCVKYIIMGLKYIANEIESGKLQITGFYPDWAQPSFNIIKFLLYAFMIAMIYPYLPGSESEIFKGVSVFVGLVVSLGSTSVIGNIIAGLVITYMRPFKIGDRIKLNDTEGNVMEKTPFVTRIITPKNEIVTIPNSFVLSSHTVNYSASAKDYGLIIHSSVTIGYDAPWRTVHALLIDAAKSTKGVLDTHEPFVFQTELSDFYPVYQINAYINDTNRLGQIYSDLHQNIQDKFNAAGVEIMSPHYRAERDGNQSTIPSSANLQN